MGAKTIKALHTLYLSRASVVSPIRLGHVNELELAFTTEAVKRIDSIRYLSYSGDFA